MGCNSAFDSSTGQVSILNDLPGIASVYSVDPRCDTVTVTHACKGQCLIVTSWHANVVLDGKYFGVFERGSGPRLSQGTRRSPCRWVLLQNQDPGRSISWNVVGVRRPYSAPISTEVRSAGDQRIGLAVLVPFQTFVVLDRTNLNPGMWNLLPGLEVIEPPAAARIVVRDGSVLLESIDATEPLLVIK